MAHTAPIASRSQRRSARRSHERSLGKAWRRAALRPVAWAVCVALGGQASLAWAGGVIVPLTVRTPGVNAIPVPVTAFTANGQQQNIASTGTGVGTVTSGNGFVKLQIDQSTGKAIYNWVSFDIGSQASVVYIMPSANSSALNRVPNSTAPSQIYGSLSSLYRDASGNLVTGGELFLINRNGILFGNGAQVNVGGLMASALNMSDDDYLSGLNNSITGLAPTFFKWVDPVTGAATYDPATNYVKVASGAKITTASGGRVFLLGANVENAGQITSPNGQVVLAAGSDVYLNTPSADNSPLYMSEANSNVPAVKGLLVEVKSNRLANESATNSGEISTPTGNTTIVGWAVNQNGRISATTSLTQNGSVFLLARSGSSTDGSLKTDNAFQTGHTLQATKGGQLVLGKGSSIEVAVDSSTDASGQTPTAAASSLFTASRIELSGQTIDFQDNASIKAPAAVVNVRASAAPLYRKQDLIEWAGSDGAASTGRITLGAGVSIDASGTTDTVVSVARNFVTTGLLGYSDLKDAPLQKDGPIYRSKLTFDIRSAAPILGDTSAYLGAVQKSASEFMSGGGTVSLVASGAVVTHETSSINVSGGKVTYTSAVVNPSILVTTSGKRDTLNSAKADVVYAGIAGQKNSTGSRFGTVVSPTLAGLGHLEAGYVDGRSGGQLNVVAPTVVMDGKLVAATLQGTRQRAGLDARAALAGLQLGSLTNLDTDGRTTFQFGDANFRGAVLNDFHVTREAQSLGDAFWASASTATVPTTGHISAAQINASGLGKLAIGSNQELVVDDEANLNLPQLASVSFMAAGAKGMTLGGSIRSEGGSVSAQTLELRSSSPFLNGQSTPLGTLTLKAGQAIDVSGSWVNQRLDGTAVAAAVAGGSVSLKSGHGLVLAEGSSIDVSGGATMASTGAVKGSNAGSIVLSSNSSATVAEANLDPVTLGASLQGYGLSSGGSLSITAGSVQLVNSTGTGSNVAQGSKASDLLIGAGFLTEGGFQNYTLNGLRSLSVSAGTTLAPRMNNWVATVAARTLATGSKVSRGMQVQQLADGLRSATNLTLSSTGSANINSGVLIMAKGAQVLADAGAKVKLTANETVEMDGAIKAAGGQVSILQEKSFAEPSTDGRLHIGSDALVDVSGTTVYTPGSGALRLGSVLAGGKITVGTTDSGSKSTVLVDKGATLLANGAQGVVAVKRALGALGPAYTEQTLGSDGGDITLNVGQAGAVLLGSTQAKAGNATASGGTFTLKNVNEKSGVVRVQEAMPEATAVTAGEAAVSAQALAAGGFADVALSAPQEINFASGLDWFVPRHLTLDAPLVSVSGSSVVSVDAGSTLMMGSSRQTGVSSSLLANSTDLGQLTLHSGFVELFGQQAVKGVKTLSVQSDTELRLLGVNNGTTASQAGALPGTLLTHANVNLRAQQVAVATATKYTLDASGAKVSISGGNASVAAPLSAGGQLTINAADIEQMGVLRAPFGSITFNATNSITLGDGSLTSVSGDGLTVPYGNTTGGGSTWTYLNNAPVSAPVEKAVVLSANGKSISINQQSTIDLSGGGALLASEFVPGPGGSKDVFAGSLNGAFAVVPTITQYAPTDAAILATGNLSQASTKGNTLALGNTITFGENEALPAGTYAILPARYALLPGAFLVMPASTTSVALGYSQKLTDSSYLVGATVGVAGTKASNVQSAGYVLMPSDVARRYSEIKLSNSDTYFADKASTAGVAAPRLSADAGRLSVVANQLLMNGAIQFDHAAGSRGGQLDIASDSIHVGGTAAAGALNLSYAQLNATGAESIVLGGVRKTTASDGTVSVAVSASKVVVDAEADASGAAQALSVGDLTLAGTQSVEVNDGARITASKVTAAADALSVKGNGALLRVSSDTAASSTRDLSSTSNVGAKGDLSLGQNVVLTGGTVVAEATHATHIAAASANGKAGTSVLAQRLTLGAQSVAAGDVPGSVSTAANAPLVVTGALLSQLGAVQDLTLRSFSNVDLYQGAALGSSKTRSLTIDAANLRVDGADTAATIQAGGVQLRNTSGVAPSQTTAGQGSLNILATGLAGGTGHLTVGAGQVGISGAGTTQLSAAGSLIVSGTGGITTPGDLSITAGSLTAAQNAQGTLSAGGAFKLAPLASDATAATVATAGAGASLTVTANTIDQQGRIVLPSGELTLQANKLLSFSGASVTDLSGLKQTVDGVALASMGGKLSATSLTSDVTQSAGSVINVSAGSGSGTAGSMSFSATQGSVKLAGRLVATSSTAQSGGSLVIDSGKSVDLAALANAIAAEQSSTLSNLSQSISVRTRLQDQDLTAGAGTVLAAQNIELSSDLGDVLVGGALHATSQSGGHIGLSAGGNVVVQSGADLQAHADAGNESVQSTGGAIELASSGLVRGDGSLGTVKLAGGTLDTTGLNGGQDGNVKLRATQEALLADKAAFGSTFKGVNALKVEAFNVIQADSGLVSDYVDAAKASVANLFAVSAGSSEAQQITQRMAAGNASLSNLIQMQAGVEMRSAGDLTVSDNLNLMSWRSGAALAPVNLTLRAGGNLLVQASISDGLLSANGDTSSVSTSDLATAAGGDIRLVGGADTQAANVMTTTASSTNGDVLLGNAAQDNYGDAATDVMVRTTTGDIHIAAGRDVSLLNPHAVVYTTGLQAATPSGFALDDIGYGSVPSLLTGATSPFTTGGGSVHVSAQRDVLALTDLSLGTNDFEVPQQYVTDWWWRYTNADSGNGQTNMVSRYDQFQQGFATFGGGNVAVQAGRDAWNVSVSAAASGYSSASGDTHSYGGGSVSLMAGRDITGGGTFAADNTLVLAGGSIGKQTAKDNSVADLRDAAPSNPVVLYGDGQTQVMARGGVTLSAVNQVENISSPLEDAYVFFFSPDFLPQPVPLAHASLNVSTIAGNINWDDHLNAYRYTVAAGSVDDKGNLVLEKGTTSSERPFEGPTSGTAGPSLPANASLEAGQGGIDLSALNAAQTPLTQRIVSSAGANGSGSTQLSSLNFIGRDKVSVGNFTQSLVTASGEVNLFQVGNADSEPVRVVSTENDVSYGNLYLTEALHMKSGQDIAGLPSSIINIQHQSATSLSILEAKRDVDLSAATTADGINIDGPGDLIVAAGRHVDLHQTSGIQAKGNRVNSALPAGSANILVLAGVSLAQGDVSAATAAYFELLGDAGVGRFAADIYAQLLAAQQGQAVPGLNSSAAQAFAALPVSEQLRQAQALAGDAAYQQRVLSFMQHREDPNLSMAQALAQFNTLSDAEKAPMVGLLLAPVWAAALPKDAQVSAALSMAATLRNPYTDKLIGFVKARTGNTLSAAEATKLFATLTPEVQALFNTQVLVSEMNAVVSKAAVLTGAAKDAAYASAYSALDTMFPATALNHSDLQMGTSRLKTLQGSEINVFAPNGGVNVGQLTAGGSNAPDLGIITAGSGNLAVVARDNVLVNQSRIFTVTKGDELVWSSVGNVDAGRGAKTVTAAASPVYYLDNTGSLQVDVTSAISGSGIAATGVARIAAPKGEINAGDAGISATGGLELAATLVRGADNISSPVISGAPAAAPVNAALTATTPTQPTASGNKDSSGDDEAKEKRRKKRNILLDFLGFGSGSDS
jgi:filamentous hemagglutinin family protein